MQKETVFIYTMHFQKILFGLKQNNAVLIEQFYQELKEDVKNNIVKED